MAPSTASDDIATRIGPVRSRSGWLFAAIWLVYLVQPLSTTFDGKHSRFQVTFSVIGFALFCVAYSWLASVVRVGSGPVNTGPPLSRRRIGLLATLAALAVLMPVVCDGSWVALWIYVSSGCGLSLPLGRPNWALRGGIASTAAICVLGPLLRQPAASWGQLVLPGLFSCLVVLGVRRMQVVINQLREAREEVKRLAASEERLRMARDLHDLAGHSLATITLKAELARKLLPVDPQAAEKQLFDIEQVSRQSLADFREAVSGYRRPTLAVETASARTAFDAAGIAFAADPGLVGRSGADGFDPEVEAALAWCLREAATNVVRHSGAARCTARLIEARVDGVRTLTLEVCDDGPARPAEAVEPGEPAEPGADGVGPGWGNGLTGLRERLAPLRATLSAAPARPHGFRVAATVPLD
jgi:two-component system, NarL family, sensor histidine kinase DesK